MDADAVLAVMGALDGLVDGMCSTNIQSTVFFHA